MANVTIQMRRDTAANWTSADPTLAAGEWGFETDTGLVKIGTGAIAWVSLGYVTNVNTLNATTITATAGAGFQNMVVQTTGTAASYSLPAALQVANAKFKVTIVGGGGQGGGTAATAGQVGGGGAGGGVVVQHFIYVSGQNSLTYTVGAGGSGAGNNIIGVAGVDSSVVYNSITYTAGGGGGGPIAASAASAAGGTATDGVLNIIGQAGGNSGTAAATAPAIGNGGSVGLGLGFGAVVPFTSGVGVAATSGFGGGGSGAFNNATGTTRAGGAGATGVVIIEF